MRNDARCQSLASTCPCMYVLPNPREIDLCDFQSLSHPNCQLSIKIGSWRSHVPCGMPVSRTRRHRTQQLRQSYRQPGPSLQGATVAPRSPQDGWQEIYDALGATDQLWPDAESVGVKHQESQLGRKSLAQHKTLGSSATKVLGLYLYHRKVCPPSPSIWLVMPCVSLRCNVEQDSRAAANKPNTSPGILTPLIRNTRHCSGHWGVHRGNRSGSFCIGS